MPTKDANANKKKMDQMDNKVKELAEKEQLNAVKAYKEKLENDRMAARAQEHDATNARFTRTDEKGNKITAWEDMVREATHAANEKVTGMNSTWFYAMLGLLDLYGSMNKAVYAALEMNVRQPLKEAIVDKFMLGMIKDSFIKPPKDITLPSLAHNVTLTDDNKLKIEVSPSFDSLKEHAEDLEKVFRPGVIQWLNDNGYDENPAAKGTFVHQNGTVLDKATFNTLKDDPDNGLSHFLSKESDLSYTQTGLTP